MTADFDLVIPRRGTHTSKWDGWPADVLPLDVGDMDFAVAPAILERLRLRLGHPILGYAEVPQALLETVARRLEARFEWAVDPDWIVGLPGITAGLAAACRALSRQPGRLCYASPIYHGIRGLAEMTSREALELPLRRVGTGWSLTDALAAAPVQAGDVLVLCNPHNPTGTCHREDELRRIGDLCEARGLTVVCDEAFCDLVLDPAHRHRPFASLGPDQAWRSVTFVSPAKGFNIPGASCAFLIAPDPAKREAVVRALEGSAGKVQALSVAATQAAYEEADDWYRALIAYLRGNLRHLQERCAGWAGFEPCPAEAGFLAWIDVRPRTSDEAAALLLSRARVALAPGRRFGDPGFVRLNFGCPRSVLARALDAVEAALGTGPRGWHR